MPSLKASYPARCAFAAKTLPCPEAESPVSSACSPRCCSVAWQVRRLVPGQDPVQFLAASPGVVLSMAQAGLESAIDGNLV